MAKYSAVKATVNAYIKQNGRKEITGKVLNAVLNATIDSLGKYFQFAGGALPTDNPGTPDQNVCYLAGEPGVYTNFGGITIENEEVALLFWDGEWTKQRILIGIREVNASVDNQVGTPSVDVSYSGGELVLTFHNLKGGQGETGDPAGFGTIGADINGGVGTPGVSVETSGDNTAKNLMFHFTNLKGETGVTSVVATIDDTSGTPSCQVSLVGQQLTLAFSGLKGLKGDTGVSADYPITIYNGLDSDATDQALSAAQGKVLDGKVSQLEAEVTDLDGAFDRVSIPGSDNLLDPSELEDGCYYWSGTKHDSTSYAASGFIPVTPGDVITGQRGGELAANRSDISFRFVDAYDADKQPVVASSATITSAYTVPAGIAFVRISAGYFLDYATNRPCVFANVDAMRDFEPYVAPSFKLVLKEGSNNDTHINELIDEKTQPIEGDVEVLKDEVRDLQNNYIKKSVLQENSLSFESIAPIEQEVPVTLSTRNLILFPYSFSDGDLNGLNFQIRSDGSIALWGTPSSNTLLYLRDSDNVVLFKAGTYTMSLKANRNIGSSVRLFVPNVFGAAVPSYYDTPKTETIENDIHSIISIAVLTSFSATQDNPLIVYPMVESGSVEHGYQFPKTKGSADATPYLSNVTLSVAHNGNTTSETISDGMGEIPINDDGGMLSITSLVPLTITATATVVKPEEKQLGIALSASVGVTPVTVSKASLANGETLDLYYSLAKKNKVFTFFGKLSTFGELTIKHGEQTYSSGRVVIDGTKVVVKVYYSGWTEYLNEAHGLTFSDYIGVVLTVNENAGLKIFIYTNGGSYTKANVGWSSGRGVLQVENSGNQAFTDVVATWNCSDFKKPVWVFGDSYIGYPDSARWPKYVVEWGNGNFLLSGFGGEGATDGLTDFLSATNHGTPKAALWLLGMNNGDTGGAINSTWLSGVQSFISKCNELGVEPILATIPNTPNIEHTYKNTWVVASGYRYIDFASAVGASNYPSSWTSGMLSNDNVHPSVQGAITLAMAAASAVPELLQK